MPGTLCAGINVITARDGSGNAEHRQQWALRTRTTNARSHTKKDLPQRWYTTKHPKTTNEESICLTWWTITITS